MERLPAQDLADWIVDEIKRVFQPYVVQFGMAVVDEDQWAMGPTVYFRRGDRLLYVCFEMRDGYTFVSLGKTSSPGVDVDPDSMEDLERMLGLDIPDNWGIHDEARISKALSTLRDALMQNEGVWDSIG